MKNSLTIIAIITILGHSYAQVSLYIEPTISQKVYLSSSLLPAFNHSGFNHSNHFSDNPYFGISNKLISYRADVPFGVNLGIKLNNTGHYFKIGYSQDGIGSATEISTLSQSSIPNGLGEKNYNEIIDFYKSLHFVNRISFGYSSKDLSSKSKHYPSLNFSLGLSILFGEASDYSPITLDTSSTPIILLGNSKIIGFEWSNSYNGQASLMFDLGCKVNFGLNRKSRENLYLFSLGVSYRQGLETNQFSFYKVFIEDNGDIFSTTYSTSSKGSGIYFELSRKFQVYPWRKRKDKTAHNKT